MSESPTPTLVVRLRKAITMIAHGGGKFITIPLDEAEQIVHALASPPQQEPVAWMHETKIHGSWAKVALTWTPPTTTDIGHRFTALYDRALPPGEPENPVVAICNVCGPLRKHDPNCMHTVRLLPAFYEPGEPAAQEQGSDGERIKLALNNAAAMLGVTAAQYKEQHGEPHLTMESLRAECGLLSARTARALAAGEPSPTKRRLAAPTSERGQWCQPGDDLTRRWVLLYEDPDAGISVFDNEVEARAAYERAIPSWTCYLLCAVAAAPTSEPSYVEVRLSACHAGSDGDCSWEDCPQLRDGEPRATGRYCPNASEPAAVPDLSKKEGPVAGESYDMGGFGLPSAVPDPFDLLARVKALNFQTTAAPDDQPMDGADDPGSNSGAKRPRRLRRAGASKFPIENFCDRLDCTRPFDHVGECDLTNYVPREPTSKQAYEYRTTDGQRKAWDGEPDLSKEGWEEHREWERFDYHEKRYWRRPIVPLPEPEE